MRYFIIASVFIIIFLVGYTRIKITPKITYRSALEEVIKRKQLSTIQCTPDWATYHISTEEIQQMIPLPGIGAHKWKITTKNDSAQYYFNQGINLYYGFHIIEAIPSFKKAQTFDSSCAMLYWAEAQAYGPNINDMGYAASPAALIATQKAKTLISSATIKEKDLIEAIQVRYSYDSTQKREILNERFADKMKTLYAMYNGDPEIGALYAEALMLQHPWDLWQHDGEPKPWTMLIERTLQNVLKQSPEHPGANHYYIHTVEASPHAFKATASADRLRKLAPGLAHMVHMPSHIYIRTGQYEKGVMANKLAVDNYFTYLKLYPAVSNNAPLYEIHSRHMKAACSMNENDYAAAIEDAITCSKSFDFSFLAMDAPTGPYIQYVYMTPELTMLTFKKWNEIFKQPDVQTRFHYAALLQQFTRGMAFANTNNLLMAKSALTNMETLIHEKDLAVIYPPFNAPVTGASIAKNLLLGTIAEKEGKFKMAINYFKQAIVTENSLVYNEPRDWLTPARHYLGEALLFQQKYNEAAKIFREDLKVHPLNYVATKGLKQAINKTKQTDREP